MLFSDFKFKTSAQSTNAVITQIDAEWHGGNDNYAYNVYVAYTAGGKAYQGQLDFYKSSMRKGKRIKIYYNPDSPEEFIGDKGMWPIAIIIVAVIITCGCVISIYKTLNKPSYDLEVKT